MSGRWSKFAFLLVVGCLVGGCRNSQAASDPLPSWNDGPAKRGILEFVDATTHQGASTFVPPAERIATFDNDGTLWVEQPIYTQFVFAIDRLAIGAPIIPSGKPKSRTRRSSAVTGRRLGNSRWRMSRRSWQSPTAG